MGKVKEINMELCGTLGLAITGNICHVLASIIKKNGYQNLVQIAVVEERTAHQTYGLQQGNTFSLRSPVRKRGEGASVPASLLFLLPIY